MGNSKITFFLTLCPSDISLYQKGEFGNCLIVGHSNFALSYLSPFDKGDERGTSGGVRIK